MRRLAVLKHADGTRTQQICRDQSAAIDWLASHRKVGDQIEVHDADRICPNCGQATLTLITDLRTGKRFCWRCGGEPQGGDK